MKTKKELTLFKSIIESSNAAITISDSTGTLMYVNQAYEKHFGRSFEEAVLLSLEDYYPAETLKIFNDKIQPALNQGIPWEGEIEVFHKNGQSIPIWAHAGSILDTKGESVIFFTILDDISAQKKAEKDKLHFEMMKGEESERLRIAHDLHNHIGHIIIAIKIHIERAIASATNNTNREQLERLLDKVIYALKEVRLVSSKLAGRFPTPSGINQQISTFLTDLEITSNIQVVQKIDPLPEEIPAALLRTIVGILEEALTNVMKHSGANRVYIHIFIKNNRLYINLRDNGNGIANTFDHHGSGLLFLKEEAEQIGGEISIKSLPGKFCMLKFNAPIIPA
jgi:PAS domain S-box-containing protein